VTARAVWASLPTIGIVAFLCACAPAHTPAATGRAAPTDILAVPAAASHDQAPRRYRSSTNNTRPRPRPTARRFQHHYEVQQARADTVNPPFDAGE
jgi:hypothetical protein